MRFRLLLVAAALAGAATVFVARDARHGHAGHSGGGHRR